VSTFGLFAFEDRVGEFAGHFLLFLRLRKAVSSKDDPIRGGPALPPVPKYADFRLHIFSFIIF